MNHLPLSFVAAPVDAIYLSNLNKSIYSGNSVLKYDERDPGLLRCISIGGYPPPEVQVLCAT